MGADAKGWSEQNNVTKANIKIKIKGPQGAEDVGLSKYQNVTEATLLI